LVRAEALCQAELRLADLAALCRDDHDPVRRLGTVDRRGRAALEYLDSLDVFGIEIRDPVDRVVLVARVATGLRGGDSVGTVRNRLVAGHDAIDDEQRIDVRIDGGDPPQVDLNAAPRRAGIRLNQCTRNLALQGAFQGARWRAGQLAAADGRHGVGKILSLDTRGLARDHDFFEPEHVRLEGRVSGGLLGRHRDLRPLKAYRSYHQRQWSIRRIQGIPPICPSLGYDPSSCHADRRFG
jgi:hypothetical protein